ncbi:MAG TPA: hypothetical protein ENG70_04515 [Candidatus Cloacimonetes bacterium]|nr:hypothetical protein [Candidatus Cloacimonadota bacterium]HEX38106.1 hypothetical protein [Candidatus Cloacimonadota bacterium]
MWNNYLFLIVVIPIIATIINLFVPKIIKKLLTLAAVIWTLVLSIKVFTAETMSFGLFGTNIFLTDQLSKFILLFVNILSLIILIYCLKNVKSDYESKFFLLFSLTVSFCNGVALSSNMIAFIVFWGLSGLLVYLFGLLNAPKSADSSRKAFIIIGTSDVLLLFGLVVMYVLSKHTNLYLMRIPLTSVLSYIAFFCVLLAAFAKAGAIPMHTWVPDFAKDAPIESVALLPAALDKLLGIYLLARMMSGLFEYPFAIRAIVMILGALTIIVAVMMALIQHNGRKLLGYHAVSQVGYMVLGIGTGNPIGIIGGLFHMVNHAIYKSSLFLSFGSVEKRTGTPELEKLGGLARKMPLTFVAALIGALSISGIPPFNGFFSKWMVYQGVLMTASKQGATWQIVINICFILAIFGSALTLASFIKFLHATFLSKLPKKFSDVKEISFNNWFANLLLGALCVIFGVLVFAVPVKWFLLPIIGAGSIKTFLLGFYSSKIILYFFAASILLGLIIYLIFKRIRFDDEYVGTYPTTEQNRATGVEFYNEVSSMRPFNKIYEWANKKYFDIYKWGTVFSLWLGDVFHKLHSGLLHTYAIWTLAGLVVVTIILLSAI